MAKSLLPRTVDPVAAWLTSTWENAADASTEPQNKCSCHALRRCAAHLSSSNRPRPRASSRVANAPTLAREPPPCMLTHPCVLPHCIAHKLLPRPFGRHGARPRPQARTILAPQQAAVLRDKEEQAASHERALVDQQPGIGALHRLHELDAPFPDEWAPPFPIGFAFLCPSSRSQHSQ